MSTTSTLEPAGPHGSAPQSRQPRRRPLLRRVAAVGVALAATAAGVVATAAPAQAAAADCTRGGSYGGRAVYYCTIWKANTPIYASTSQGSGVIDHLHASGRANWFFCQKNGSTATGSGYSASNWAQTVGDDAGRTGWVPAIYFSGAQNYWVGLPACGGTTTPPPTSSTRQATIKRAKTWLTAYNGGKVPHSQSSYFGGYRQDCSGYVSMALALGGPGSNTVGLTSTSITRRITLGELKQGDLLIDAIGDSNTRHVVMFDHWNNSARSSYTAYEQSGSWNGTRYNTGLTSGLSSGSEYKPYRPLKYGD